MDPKGKFIVHGGNLHMRGMIFSHTPVDYVHPDTVPKLLGIPYISVQQDGLLSNMGLTGNQLHAIIPNDSRLGSLEVTLSPEYQRQTLPTSGGVEFNSGY